MTGGLMRDVPSVGNYRWAGSSHEKLYNDVKGDVQGTSSLEATTTTWATFIDGVTQTRGAVERLLAEAGAEWQGGAAQSMAAGVSPLAAWADQAALAGQQSQASLQQVAESFTYAANAMPEPVPIPSKATQGIPTSFPEMIAGQTDEDAIDQEAQQAHLRAIDVMTGYNVHAQESASSIGTFVEPQPIGVNAQADGGMGRSGGDTIETSSSDDSSGESGGPGSGGPGGGGPGGGGPSGSSSPYPGGQPGGSPSPGSQSGTDAAAAQAPPAPIVPSGGGTPHVPTTSPPPTSHPFAPITGVLNEPGRGGGPGGRGVGGGGGGGGFGGRSGGLPGGGGAPGTGGTPAPGRGGVVGTGPLPAEGAAARGGPAAGGRGGAPGAFGPMGGAGAGQKDEDKERTSAEYLRDYNDEFWDDSPPVAPPVIGEDDD